MILPSPVDHGAGVAFRFLPAADRVFSEGWGDESEFSLLDPTGLHGTAESIAVEWDDYRILEGGGLLEAGGRFHSPCPYLDAGRRQGYALRTAPPAGVRAWCVLLPAWNDHGFGTRRLLARAVAPYGIGTVMLEGSYYGDRRPGEGQPVKTVADFARLTRSVIEEGRGLLAGLLDGPVPAGISGFSMGGSLAAVVGASLDGRFALAPLAAGFSPSPSFVDGAIRNAVDWVALGGREESGRLESVLLRADTRLIEPSAATRSAVLAAARSDGYIPACATEAIHHHWPGSELRSIRAGHATLIIRKHRALAEVIADSFVRAGLL